MFSGGKYYLTAGCIGLGALLKLTLGLGIPVPLAVTIPTTLSCPISSLVGFKLTICRTQPAGAAVTAAVKVQGGPVSTMKNGEVRVDADSSAANQLNASGSATAGIKTRGAKSNCGCGAPTISLPSLQVNVGATVNAALNGLGENSGCGCGKSGGLNINAGANADVGVQAQVGNRTAVQLQVGAASTPAIKLGAN